MKGLATGGSWCLQPRLFHEKRSRTGEEANCRAVGPPSSSALSWNLLNLPTLILLSRLSQIRRSHKSGGGLPQHSVPTAVSQLVNLPFFMGSFGASSPLGFKKAGILHFDLGLGRKHCISPLVTISLKKALFCPAFLERAE